MLERAQSVYRADEPPSRVMAALVEGVWACPEHLDDVADLLPRERCDALVVDCMMFGALAALEGAAVPVAVLVHSVPGALAPPGGAGEHLMLGAVNEVRAAGPVPGNAAVRAHVPHAEVLPQAAATVICRRSANYLIARHPQVRPGRQQQDRIRSHQPSSRPTTRTGPPPAQKHLPVAMRPWTAATSGTQRDRAALRRHTSRTVTCINTSPKEADLTMPTRDHPTPETLSTGC